jgi:hypothetical protein
MPRPPTKKQEREMLRRAGRVSLSVSLFDGLQTLLSESALGRAARTMAREMLDALTLAEAQGKGPNDGMLGMQEVLGRWFTSENRPSPYARSMLKSQQRTAARLKRKVSKRRAKPSR